jgi:hypothetical protein
VTTSPRWFEQRRVLLLVLGACIAVGVLPVWATRHQPGVDFPQHLFLIHVLESVNDPASFYAADYVAKPGLTYVTFYYTVRALAPLVGLENAFRLWLTLVLAGIPISVAFLLKALGRSPWLALLAIPVIYTDNYYWGLISFISSLPFTFLTMAFFVRVLEESPPRRSSWIVLALSLLLLQLTHAAGMIFPALALPLLLVTTPSNRQRRVRALLGITPGVVLFLAWLVAGVHQGRRMGKPGEPWTASAPLLDARNFVFAPLGHKLAEFWNLLADGFWTWADRPPIQLWAVLMGLALVAGLVWGKRQPLSVAAVRPHLLLALALACFFLLPSDITGYMYQIYPRYAQVAALLAIGVISLPTRLTALFVPAAGALAIYSGGLLATLFHRFDVEAERFEPVAAAIAPHSRIMHLVTETSSRVATHAVYLHYAALAAMERDGMSSFSLAIDPSFPVGYRHGLPPASPSEWQPTQFTWDEQARHYDYFLLHGGGASPALFGAHAGDVELVKQVDRWTLFHKRGGAE